MYTIDKNIPIPNSSITKPKGRLRLTMEQMEIGDSIQIESVNKRGTAYMAARAIGIKIKTSSSDDDYLRIWRVK